MEPFAFVTSLAAGQILAQQLHHGTGSGTTSMGPPKRPMMPATRPANECSNLPTCPMVYAIISDMNIFGNPNVPDSSYSAYPPQVPVNTPVLPALVPLGLLDVTLNVECHISTAFVTVEGTWDLNCVRSRATCDCLLALPMDHQVCHLSCGVFFDENVYANVLGLAVLKNLIGLHLKGYIQSVVTQIAK